MTHKGSVIDGEAYSKLLRIQDTLERLEECSWKNALFARHISNLLPKYRRKLAQGVIRDRSFRKVREEFSPAISQMANLVIGVAYIADHRSSFQEIEANF